ncbi:glycosyltransferase [Niallia hominis]|uniref:Glycosyltransferase n=1 Tax=Niallia hominis TaxID=3133173 RepID=A0ABV1EW93_9BACI
MNNKKFISIYVRNKEITPSSYYRVVQYVSKLEGRITINSMSTKGIYSMHLNSHQENKIKWFLISAIYFFIILCRSTYFLIRDCMIKPKYIIISKSICPRYTPYYLKLLILKLVKNTVVYWDFDDYIFSGEISKTEAEILEKYSNKIVVTNEFLKAKIKPQYQDKVILLPTTDGDMQGYNKRELRKKRKVLFDREIKLIWVATSGNIPNLKKIISSLDKAAKIVSESYDKKLVLTIVCNKSVNVHLEYLEIRNIKWTRDIAIKEIFNSHIGIMPLLHNEYSLGKGGFKLVQYISTGLPVIASNVGFNSEIVNESCGFLLDDRKDPDVWIDAIIKIISSWNYWVSYSECAMERWNKKFSFNNNLMTWKKLLDS